MDATEEKFKRHELYPVLLNLHRKFQGKQPKFEIIEPTIFIGEDEALDEVLFENVRKTAQQMKDIDAIITDLSNFVQITVDTMKKEVQNFNTSQIMENIEIESIPEIREAKRKRPDISKMAKEYNEKKYRGRNGFPKDSVSVLKEWLDGNMDNPYPSSEEKEKMAASTGLSVAQINQWFVNARRRYI